MKTSLGGVVGKKEIIILKLKKEKMLKKGISSFFRYLLEKSIANNHDQLFLWFVNLRFLFLHKNLKISKTIVKNQKAFKAWDANLKMGRYFIIKNQGYLSYHNGFYNRAINMGETSYLLEHILFKPNDIIFDIGANLGDLTLYFDLKKIPIRYYGFEPGKYEFICLKKNVMNYQNHKIYNIALGNKNAETPFYYKPFNGDSSIVKIDDYDEKYTVKIVKLDSFIKEKDLVDSKIKLIKLEAEGFEPEITEGLRKNLKNVEYISADLGFERGVNQQTTAPKVINYLLKNGFKLLAFGESRSTFLFKNQIF